MKELLITLMTFISMEAVTWLTHRFVMHGFLWKLHADHHNKDKERFFERNDYFFVIFALPAMVLFAVGTVVPSLRWLIFLALGVTLYGLTYFIVHEVFIHRRFRWKIKGDNLYFRAIRKAHKVHHKHLGRTHGECFGMLLVPLKYFIEARRNKRT